MSIDRKVPRPRKIRMSSDPKCAALHPKPILSDTLVVDEKRGVRWAFVYVKSGLKSLQTQAPNDPIVLNQKGCQYAPHVFGIRVGQRLIIRNSDPLLHNVHVLPFGNRERNIAQQPNQEHLHAFTTKEFPVKIKCDIHPWMLAWAGVMEHPFFSVTDAKGEYEITGIPAGRYTIEVWHEAYKSVTAEVDVETKEAVVIDFALRERK